MEISIVIPNLNSTFIDQTLAALRRQDFDLSQTEVLVVGLDEPGLVLEDDLIRLISTGRPVNPAIARNIGIGQARGSIICFTDADCLPDQNWLTCLADRLRQNGVEVVGGGVAFAHDNYWTWCDNLSWFAEFLTTTPAGMRQLLPSLNLALRRSVIEAVGGFDEGYPRAAGEDADWTLRMRRAGYELHFEPQAIITHCPSRSNLADLWRHGRTYGQFSTKINPAYASFLPSSWVLRGWGLLALLALLSPAVAAGATIRVMQRTQLWAQAWSAIPGIYLSKLAWCVGAISALRRRKR